MKKILIVDDDPFSREALKEVVTEYGYQAFPVSSAREAVALLAREWVDLILLDMSMPEITGDQLLSFIRKKGFKTPALAVSAYMTAELTHRLKQAGVSGIVTKPFDVGTLIDEMDRALKSGRRGPGAGR